jgi:hypothetical protein
MLAKCVSICLCVCLSVCHVRNSKPFVTKFCMVDRMVWLNMKLEAFFDLFLRMHSENMAPKCSESRI